MYHRLKHLRQSFEVIVHALCVSVFKMSIIYHTGTVMYRSISTLHVYGVDQKRMHSTTAAINMQRAESRGGTTVEPGGRWGRPKKIPRRSGGDHP